MAHIIFDQKQIELEDGQSVLSVLLNQDYAIPNSCQAGVCQSCLMQAVEGEIPEAAQVGLKDTLKAQGYFLACCCQPEETLHVVAANETQLRSSAIVMEHERLGTDILRLRLQPPANFKYRAGQYINIWKTENLARSYSLASVSHLDDTLELHIRHVADGQVSSWLHNEIKPGDSLQIQEASGDCFYVPENAQDKMLLAGTGTGLAPLIGIARDAISQGYTGEIHLIHGVRQEQDLYLHHTLQEMASQHSQFYYYANVLESASESENISLEQQVLNLVAEPAQCKAYLCGDANIVNTLKKKLFLSGMAMTDIYSDAFLISTAK